MHKRLVTTAAVVVTVSGVLAQSAARGRLARGNALWDQRLANSAIAALEAAARDRSTAPEAYEALGRLYTFKGWLQDNVFPGWHDEPAYREKALAALKASLAADATRASAQEALRMVEGFAAADKVDPAAPRPEVRALDVKLQSYQTTGSDPKSGSDPATVSDIVAAIEARAKAQADPAPYFTGAQILIDRGEYDLAIAMAQRGVAASDRFIDENLSAY